MNKLALILPGLILSLCLVSCGGDIDGFTGSGSSSSNIISAKNFDVFFSPIDPAVIDADGFHGDVEVTITAHAADKFNLVTSGNTVYFRSQWGVLDALSCTISNGSCSIKWLSNSNFSLIPADNKTAITAYTLGEEAFTDLNGNAVFDDGDVPGFDFAEPFQDLDHSFTYTFGTDAIIDLDKNGIHTPADGKHNSVGCAHSNPSVCGVSQIYIYDISHLALDATLTTTPTFTVTIDTPNDLDTFANGTNINFTATASDPQDGNITGTDTPVAGDDIVWSSDLVGGPIGTSSNNINVNTLAVGTHVITVTATDSDGNMITSSISITIT